MTAAKNLTGARFCRLVAIRVDGRTPAGRPTWLCRCDCGGESRVETTNLLTGNTRSCGCLNSETRKVARLAHGQSDRTGGPASREYRSWSAMWARCTNARLRTFPNYGGRGISVCERWRSFEAFLSDLGPRPPDTTLDRIDNGGNYEPGNVRWATRSQQNLNRRPRRKR